MFDAQIYIERRNKLKQRIKSGLAIFPGNNESIINYGGNTSRFRQDSTFLYYFGLDYAGLGAIIDFETGQDTVFGNDLEIEDVVWMGPQPKLIDRSEKVGIKNVQPLNKFEETIKTALKQNRQIHYLPPYRWEHFQFLTAVFVKDEQFIKSNHSVELIKAVVAQRSVKSDAELARIELAHAITFEMHTRAMKMATPGIKEQVISGAIEGIALAGGGDVSFLPIVSIRGETLHNHYHGNTMKDGDLLLIDAGAEDEMHYAADITRTFPVNGKFTQRQKDIYKIVLESQLNAIAAIKPGAKFSEIHLLAAKVIVDGLKNLGIMKGDINQAVEQGAHALFFPHGLGHMMGLDVHDMENLGENYVGYDEKTKRSEQFGLAYLRLAKEMQPGFVLTVEPGIYFIPALIDMWKSENKFAEFINYDEVEEYKSFGGIRIEDDIAVTKTGYEVIGNSIPKTVDEVEVLCNS